MDYYNIIIFGKELETIQSKIEERLTAHQVLYFNDTDPKQIKGKIRPQILNKSDV